MRLVGEGPVQTIKRRLDEPKLQLGDNVSLNDGAVGVVVMPGTRLLVIKTKFDISFTYAIAKSRIRTAGGVMVFGWGLVKGCNQKPLPMALSSGSQHDERAQISTPDSARLQIG